MLSHTQGLVKVGTGHHGTVCGAVYAQYPELSLHASGFIACCTHPTTKDEVIALRTPLLDPYTLLLLDCNTLQPLDTVLKLSVEPDAQRVVDLKWALEEIDVFGSGAEQMVTACRPLSESAVATVKEAFLRPWSFGLAIPVGPHQVVIPQRHSLFLRAKDAEGKERTCPLRVVQSGKRDR